MFSANGWILYILGFVDHMFSVATNQHCCYNVSTAIDNKQINDCGCVPMKLYLQSASWIQNKDYKFTNTFLPPKLFILDKLGGVHFWYKEQ